MPVDVSVVLPTYNERDNICDLIDAIRHELRRQGYRYEVMVVDDSSPDGTAEVVRRRYQLGRHDGGADCRAVIRWQPCGSLCAQRTRGWPSRFATG